MSATALLSGGGGARVMNLAAAADSLDYLADVIQACISQAVADLPNSPERSMTPRSRAANGDAMLNLATGKSSGLPLNGLDHLVDRCNPRPCVSTFAGYSMKAVPCTS